MRASAVNGSPVAAPRQLGAFEGIEFAPNAFTPSKMAPDTTSRQKLCMAPSAVARLQCALDRSVGQRFHDLIAGGSRMYAIAGQIGRHAEFAIGHRRVVIDVGEFLRAAIGAQPLVEFDNRGTWVQAA